MITITQPIVKVAVAKHRDKPEHTSGEDRPESLNGTTYKIKPGTIADAIYITINNLEDRVYEMFISTKNPDQAYHLGTMARLISALWRRDKNPTFVIEELKAMKSIQGYFADGTWYDSIIAHIAHIIEKHMLKDGSLDAPIKLVEPEICIDCE